MEVAEVAREVEEELEGMVSLPFPSIPDKGPSRVPFRPATGLVPFPASVPFPGKPVGKLPAAEREEMTEVISAVTELTRKSLATEIKDAEPLITCARGPAEGPAHMMVGTENAAELVVGAVNWVEVIEDILRKIED